MHEYIYRARHLSWNFFGLLVRLCPSINEYCDEIVLHVLGVGLLIITFNITMVHRDYNFSLDPEPLTSRFLITLFIRK